MPAFDCSIMIATRNRRDDLKETLAAVGMLDPGPAEILVCADGCTDDTAAMIGREFPGVQVIEHASSHGSVASRNELLREARGEFVLSLDDDSHPVEADFLGFAREEFMARPKLAVLSFPQRSEEFPESLVRSDFGPSLFVGSYASSGAMLRRSAYLTLPGYPGFFFHAYEEPDYALQCTGAGWQVLHCTARTIRHRYTNANRNEIRIHHRHARNEALSVLMRCPLPQAPAVLAFRLLRQAGYAASRGAHWLVREPVWWASFLKIAPSALATRHPIPWRLYSAWMRLVRQPIASEESWRAMTRR